MSSQNGGYKSGEYQFNRFREVARKLGTERLTEELEESLARLVPPVPHSAVNGSLNERQRASGRLPSERDAQRESFDGVPTGPAYMRMAPTGIGTEISASEAQSPKPEHDQG